MTFDEFGIQMTRLRNHFGDRHYSSEIIGLLYRAFSGLHKLDFERIVTEAIVTRSQAKAPLRDDFVQIADSLGLESKRKDAWTYFEVDDCLRCSGCGWFWIRRIDGGRSTRCCSDCMAGKNLQQAPKGTIKEFKIPLGWAYDGPGKAHKHTDLHPELKRRFGSWQGLESAIRDKRISTNAIYNYFKSKGLEF